MIDCISVENMRASDEATISGGVPGIVLMRRAAVGIYLASRERFDSASSIVIVTGSGNNGGDGFALSLVLLEHGVESVILTLSEKASADAGYYRSKCVESDIKVMPFDASYLNGADIIVDCLLGTGFNRALREDYLNAINAINASSAYVISADINSGMNGDTGLYETCVRSDLTVTIGSLKKGLITQSALSKIGSIVVADIGIGLVYKEDLIDESLYGIKVLEAKE